MEAKWKVSSEGWGLILILIHWITAFCVIGLFALGWWMTELDYYSKWYQTAPFIHKSVGILLLFLTILRLIYRLINITPTPLKNHKKIEIKLAHLVHRAIYALLFTILISGYLISTADGRGISVFNLFELPALPWSIKNQEDIAGDVHFWIACFLMGIVLLHALAALKHHFIDKDDTLKRMMSKNK